MLELEEGLCRVEITEDRTYTIGSADNRYYNVVLNPGGYRRGDWTTTLCIDIDLLVEQRRVANGELRERSIVLYDFEDNRYEIDYDGNIII